MISRWDGWDWDARNIADWTRNFGGVKGAQETKDIANQNDIPLGWAGLGCQKHRRLDEKSRWVKGHKKPRTSQIRNDTPLGWAGLGSQKHRRLNEEFRWSERGTRNQGHRKSE